MRRKTHNELPFLEFDYRTFFRYCLVTIDMLCCPDALLCRHRSKMKISYNRLCLTTSLRIWISLFFISIISTYLFSNCFLTNQSPLLVPTCPYTSFTKPDLIEFGNSSYFLHNYPEFICPQNFRNLADWIYGWPKNVFDEELEYFGKDNRSLVPYLPYGSIFYVKTDMLPQFFTGIYPYVLNEFVLITGQGDASAPSNYLYYLHRSDSKIIHWFGQNGDIYSSNSQKFTHIPIGK